MEGKSLTESLEEIKRTLLELAGKNPELQTFLHYVEESESARALDHKTKELMSLGIAIAVRCEPCIQWHLAEAFKAGARLEEVYDVIKVAVCMGGGPALMYGVKAYNYARELYK
ncbi:MAG: carboxymuconolactone decarboxylase family protein [Thermogladius sp.]|jgi:AhpD family alkylhydroperoxidase|nr:carboxymuconolactone decarboxylase family protein [Thermogladius sp.]